MAKNQKVDIHNNDQTWFIKLAHQYRVRTIWQEPEVDVHNNDHAYQYRARNVGKEPGGGRTQKLPDLVPQARLPVLGKDHWQRTRR